MGADQTIYIGAYLEVDLLPYNEKKEGRYCPNLCDDVLSFSGNFCTACGERILINNITKQMYLSYYNMFDTNDEDLTQIEINVPDNKMILVSNLSNGTHISLDKSDEGVYALETADKYIDKFNNAFRDRINEIYNNKYVDKVYTKYGVIIYWW